MCRSFRLISGLCAFAALVVSPACRTWTSEPGLTLPSARYLKHPPQYIPPSPQHPLPQETAAQPAQGPVAETAPPLVTLPVSAPKTEKDHYVADLLDLIAQTKSVDAFLVSVSLLAEAKPDARQVIPAVIRNAERLGIYDRYAIDEKAKGAEVAKDLTELIGRMSKGKTGSKHAKSDSYSADPNIRMQQLLEESEDLRQIQEEWSRYWWGDQPSHMSKPHRSHGGIGPDPDNPYKNILKTIKNEPAGNARSTTGVNFAPNLAKTSLEVQAVVAANNQFTLDLYHQLGKKDANLFFSPYSISKTLVMVYAGARGDTEREMAGVLHFALGQEGQHKAFLQTRKLLNGGNSSLELFNPLNFGHDVQLHLAANLWGQRGSGFQPSYLKLIKDNYGGELQEVDFAAAEPARQKINAWVEKQTRNKIKELFQQGTITPDTRLVLASAIYFKGDWVKPFKKSGTQEDNFWVSAKEKVPVRLMNQTGTFGYFEDADVQGLQLPYHGKNLAMMVLLPSKKDGLADFEKSLTAQRLATYAERFKEQKVHVWLPRFKLRARFELNGALAALGMTQAFDVNADFSGMTQGGKRLSISKVVHQAYVDVNEEGAEAAAATGVAMELWASPRASRPDPIPVFRADHPFVFAIRDLRTGMILFYGRYANP